MDVVETGWAIDADEGGCNRKGEETEERDDKECCGK